MRSSRVKKAKTAKYDNSRKDIQQDLEKALQEWEDWLGDELNEPEEWTCYFCGELADAGCTCEEEGEELNEQEEWICYFCGELADAGCTCEEEGEEL